MARNRQSLPVSVSLNFPYCNARNGACEILRRKERPLAAVLAADVAGYSRLEADEEGTQLSDPLAEFHDRITAALRDSGVPQADAQGLLLLAPLRHARLS